jgi:hypothetical protein
VVNGPFGGVGVVCGTIGEGDNASAFGTELNETDMKKHKHKATIHITILVIILVLQKA